ncbi:MAG: hypothetical protein JWO63_718 [Frankiales bacterium]|jgi:hypothetical protein|nr:hypothetical protein [Frankiales bacterium]
MSSYQADSRRTEIAYRQQKLQREFQAGGSGGQRARLDRSTQPDASRWAWTLRWDVRRPRHS